MSQLCPVLYCYQSTGSIELANTEQPEITPLSRIAQLYAAIKEQCVSSFSVIEMDHQLVRLLNFH